ncbi:hypothetical protein ACQY1Q_06055 [Tenacibaculum sp. TC6]|uniref:hypothetical protein n=1 Tax=Tenacibaculum sp. TC6 TaxID=3423223 RepID=UPI003D362EDF
MSAIYGTKTYKEDFEIDIKKLNDCKGIYKLEVFVSKESMPLLVKDGSNQIIKENYNPFIVSSPVPITKGVLRFEFKEIEGESKGFKSATVRYLYHE